MPLELHDWDAAYDPPRKPFTEALYWKPFKVGDGNRPVLLKRCTYPQFVEWNMPEFDVIYYNATKRTEQYMSYEHTCFFMVIPKNTPVKERRAKAKIWKDLWNAGL